MKTNDIMYFLPFRGTNSPRVLSLCSEDYQTSAREAPTCLRIGL